MHAAARRHPAGERPASPSPSWHCSNAADVAGRLGTDTQLGLTAAEAARRLERYGQNEIPAAERRGVAAIVAAQFTDFLILLLIAAAVIAGLLGEGTDAIAIVVIVLLNAAVGASQEYRAERAIAALRRMAAPEANVVRDGSSLRVPAAALVPGDVVELEAGDVVPADLRLTETVELHADESALTGESLAVAKDPRTLDEHAVLGDRSNMAYRSTAITRGKGSGLVVATGAQTEIGRIAALLSSAEQLRTPLQQRLAGFGRRLAIAALVICALIFVIGLLNGQPPLLMFLTAVSLAVAAVPEALPAIVTVSLAIGAKKLSRMQSLVRHLPAVETLGSVTFICTDKTGTLTENRMTLATVRAGGRDFDSVAAIDGPAGRYIGQALALCNDVTPAGRSSDPTESALFRAAADAGFDKRALLGAAPKVAELPFDEARKCMTTVHLSDEGCVAFSKGAPEQILACCERAIDAGANAVPLDLAAALEDARRLAGGGYRVLALARRELADCSDIAAQPAESVETGMDFLGLVGLTDPLRPEVPGAVADCLAAGIAPVMITGDHPATARQIAAQLGLAAAESQTLTGPQLAAMEDSELADQVRRVRVYARVSPEQKIRIVKALQQAGEVVAMTGDGVNDAPALKQASIGVAMGRRGTDVAREAADLVLLDDNFATIVTAVHEGRRVYDNITKFIKYIVPSNFGEILVLFLAPLLGLPMPLLPIQILWINLVTDGLPGLAFSAEPAESNIMRRPPRSPSASLTAGGVWQHMLWMGLLIGALSLLTALWAPAGDTSHWQSMVFTTLVVAQLFQALGMRTDTDSLLKVGLLSNAYMFGAVALSFAVQLAVLYVPPLSAIFNTTPLPLGDLAICLGLGAIVLPAVELEKWLARRGLSYR
jgi:Ca2+-transporting ATPase